jgi:hypothetical protein
MNYKYYKSCIDACMECAAVCNYCFSMDLKEKDVAMMSRCAQINMECATVCIAAAKLMSMGSEHSKEICRLCAQLCKECGDECSKHDNDHCKECEAACRKCEEACKTM